MSLKAVRILSLDGAGIRGVATATILQQIEKSTGKRIHELFDVVVGTSVGGIIAMFMTIPRKDGTVMGAAELKSGLMDHIPKVYSKPWKRWGLAKKIFFILTVVCTGFLILPFYWICYKLLRVRYSANITNEFIRNNFKADTTLKDSVTSVGVVATDLLYLQPLLLNSIRAKLYNDDYRHNAPICKIANATTALPIYFAASRARGYPT